MITQVLGRQLLITLGVSAGGFAFGWVPGYCALLGGLVSTASSTYFAYRVWAGAEGRAGYGLLLVFYWAELVKIAMAAVLLAALFVLIEDMNAFALVIGFLLVHVAGAISVAGIPAGRAGDD